MEHLRTDKPSIVKEMDVRMGEVLEWKARLSCLLADIALLLNRLNKYVTGRKIRMNL